VVKERDGAPTAAGKSAKRAGALVVKAAPAAKEGKGKSRTKPAKPPTRGGRAPADRETGRESMEAR
jgi:hypothetical protein